MAKQTLNQAIMLARTGKSADLARAAVALNGLPEGGWAETKQARVRLIDDLPMKNAREYTADEFIAAIYDIEPRGNAAGVYRTKI